MAAPRDARRRGAAACHSERDRALSFGAVAERYERARPGYPEALIDELALGPPGRVLDVGTGTGKAARLLLARGWIVLGVEPDERMAALARAHGVEVEVATFEEWEPHGRVFDLLTSAQAWHWVDPATGAAKAATLLRPRGRLALFWNHLEHQPRAHTALRSVYTRQAPELVDTSMALGKPPARDEFERGELGIVRTGLFGPVDRRFFDWERVYTSTAWLDYLSTCSDHIMLPPKQRAALLASAGETIDRDLGGSLHVQYRTHLLSASRADQS